MLGDGRGRQVKCAAGVGGDGDYIGGVFFSSSDIGAAGEADRVEVGRRIVGNKLGREKTTQLRLPEWLKQGGFAACIA